MKLAWRCIAAPVFGLILVSGSTAVAASAENGISSAGATSSVATGLGVRPTAWDDGEGHFGHLSPGTAGTTPLTTRPGATPGPVTPHATLTPGEVEIAQYGQPEDVGAFRNTGFWVIRFDPPFDPPYTITKIRFPSFTFNGVPAVFPSVRLCAPTPPVGLPNVAAPLHQVAPFAGSPDGMNEIPVNISVADSGRIFYVCVEFPSSGNADFPSNYPFLRMDYRDLERGWFATSFSLLPSGLPRESNLDRNIILSMVCQLPPEVVPIEASSNLGANLLDTGLHFTFQRPADTRADGFRMRRHSLLRTDLLWRSGQGPWHIGASVGGGATVATISLDSLPRVGPVIWTAQAVDKAGHRAVPSSTTIATNFLGFFNQVVGYDPDEPNGSPSEATPVVPPVYLRPETIFPAGDRDFFSFYAKSGDVIDASAAILGRDGYNDLDLVMLLYDNAGKIVAMGFNSNQTLDPRITYTVPQRPCSSWSVTPRKFMLRVEDIRGSLISPTTAPRVVVPIIYGLILKVGLAPAAAMRFPGDVNADGFAFRNAGPNPANPESKFLYVLPQSASGIRVTLRIYDVAGRLIRSLVDRNEQSGPHAAEWDGTDGTGRHVSSGTYYARLEAGTYRHDEKVSIVK